jgi:hypothetical protein
VRLTTCAFFSKKKTAKTILINHILNTLNTVFSLNTAYNAWIYHRQQTQGSQGKKQLPRVALVFSSHTFLFFVCSLQPPTVYSCALVDTANAGVYLKLFQDCLQAGEDASYIERITHLIMVTSKLKSATVVGAMLPLIEGVSGGEKIAEQMKEQNEKLEQMLVKISKTKKHPDNKEFVDMMDEFEKGCKKAQKIEVEALQLLIKNLDEEVLIAAAQDFEKCKLETSLEPGKMEQ